MRSFVKIKSSRFLAITLSFIDIGKSCPSREFLTPQICILSLFAKINSREYFRIYSSAMVLIFSILQKNDMKNGWVR